MCGLGDGLLVYYGYPQAHEDDAQRAIRTGLGIVEAIGMLNTRLAHERGVRLTVRVGIHTGLVVVGEMGGGDRHERLALGETPNIAAKLQGLAAPETVVISALTYRLTQDYFVSGSWAAYHQAEHSTTAVRLSRQNARRRVAGTLRCGAGLTPWWDVRRNSACCDGAGSKATGSGQVVLPGRIGYWQIAPGGGTREQVRNEGYRWLTFRCSPYHTHSAFILSSIV